MRKFVPRNAVAAAAITARISAGISFCSCPSASLAAAAAAFMSNATRNSYSQRDQSMLLLRAQFPLGVQRFKCLGQVLPCFGGFNDVVNKPPAGGNVGVGKRISIRAHQFLAAALLIFGHIDRSEERRAGNGCK